MAIDFDNNVWGWGLAVFGALGIGKKRMSQRISQPILITKSDGTPFKAKQIAGNGGLNYIVDLEGRLWVSGYGNLGLGDTKQVYVFTEIPGYIVSEVASGDFLTAIIATKY